MSESDSCHFSWLIKSCFPNPHQAHHPSPFISPSAAAAAASASASLRCLETTTISSLPDDLLLECLSRVPHSSLPSISLVCRRWSSLIDSSAFYHLRRSHSRLRLTLFAVSVSASGLYTATHRFGHDASWTISCVCPNTFVSSGYFQALFSHARLAAVGRKMYIIGQHAMLECDAWTGAITSKPVMLVARKKFAVAVIEGKIYVAGGATRAAAVEEYDPELNLWRVVAEAPRRRYGCIGASVGNVFYIIGGLKIGGAMENHITRAAGSEVHVYASSMDLYDVKSRGWLRSRAVPGGGCVVAACAAAGHVYVVASHAVELSFWRFNANSSDNSGGFGEWQRLSCPPLPPQVRLDSTVRFSCVGVEDKVVLIQVMGSIDDLLRRSGRSTRGSRGGLVLVYSSATGEWSRGVDLPEAMRRAACLCVEC